MSKILHADDVLEILTSLDLPNYYDLQRKIEEAVTEAGIAIAEHLGVAYETAEWQTKAFGGLCMIFRPKTEGQACPDLIDNADKSGDWM